MRISRFYIDSKIELNGNVILDPKDYKYITKVLRLKVGDKLHVFNETGEYNAIIISDTNQVLVKVLEKIEIKKPSKVSLTLFQGIIKLPKFEEIIEKCTELGVNYIVPVECEYSQTKIKEVFNKSERLNTIIKAATLQCERTDFPKILDGIKFSEIQTKEYDLVLIASIEREGEKVLSTKTQVLKLQNITKVLEQNPNVNKIAIVIGPEGGFSPKEHELAKSLNFEFVTLNSNILRAETAAITAVGIIRSMKVYESEKV